MNPRGKKKHYPLVTSFDDFALKCRFPNAIFDYPEGTRLRSACTLHLATGNCTPQIILVKSQHALETMVNFAFCDHKVSRKLKHPQFLTTSMKKSAKRHQQQSSLFLSARRPAGITRGSLVANHRHCGVSPYYNSRGPSASTGWQGH